MSECCVRTLAGQTKHLAKQIEMKWLLSIHSDKNKTLLMEDKCVSVCVRLLCNLAERS